MMASASPPGRWRVSRAAAAPGAPFRAPIATLATDQAGSGLAPVTDIGLTRSRDRAPSAAPRLSRMPGVRQEPRPNRPAPDRLRASIRLPIGCPQRTMPNSCCRIVATVASAGAVPTPPRPFADARRHIEPLRSRPDEPPSMATVTTAVIEWCQLAGLQTASHKLCPAAQRDDKHRSFATQDRCSACTERSVDLSAGPYQCFQRRDAAMLLHRYSDEDCHSASSRRSRHVTRDSNRW